MKKEVTLVLLVTLIDLITVWPFQGPIMQAIDVLLGIALLWYVLGSELRPRRPEVTDFGFGERVEIVAAADRYKFVYGTIVGLSQRYHGCLSVHLDGEPDHPDHYHHYEPSELRKVSLGHGFNEADSGRIDNVQYVCRPSHQLTPLVNA